MVPVMLVPVPVRIVENEIPEEVHPARFSNIDEIAPPLVGSFAIALASRRPAMKNQFAGARIVRAVIDLPQCTHFRRRQTAFPLAIPAGDSGRIEVAAPGVFDYTIFDSI